MGEREIDPRYATEDEQKTVGFFGRKPYGYTVTLLRDDLKRRKGEKAKDFNDRRCFTLKAETPEGLVEQLDELGWDAGTPEKVAELCNSTPAPWEGANV